MYNRYNIAHNTLISDNNPSLDPLDQTGSVDSRPSTDKNVLIPQNFVFSGVWHSGWNNRLLLSKMYGIQDVGPIPIIFES